MRRGEIWVIDGARERLGLIISSDVYNGTDVPVLLVAEVVEKERLRDSPLAVSPDSSQKNAPPRPWLLAKLILPAIVLGVS